MLPDLEHRPRTGSWRSEQRPELDLGRCVNCLLCWAYCPDEAFRVTEAALRAIDYDLCKACEICVVVCPVQAITMVPDGDPDGADSVGGV